MLNRECSFVMGPLLLATAAIIGATAVVGLPGRAYADNKLVVVSWGGSYSAAQRKALYEPFMKETNAVILEDEWSGDMAKIRAMVETGNYTGDVYDAESSMVLAGCDENIWERIDYKKLGISPDELLPGAANDCGVGSISWSAILAYDKDQITGEGPKSWADFWNVKKFPGKRGLYKNPRFTFEAALLADGVAVDKIYDVLRTPEGISRAFAKLDEIKPYIVWWDSGSMVPQLLASKEITMSLAWNGRISSAIDDDQRNFAIVWNGQLLEYEFWVIPKGDPRADLALKFIAFATRADRLADLTNYISYGPLRKGAEKFIKPSVLKNLPTAPDHLRNYVRLDTAFWADNNEALTEQFQVWLSN